MATTLFLRDAAATEASAPANYKRIDRTQGSSAQTKTMNNVAGSTPIQWTDGAGGANLAWISDPLLAGVTISGTITLNIRGSESNNNDNVGPRVEIYKYSGGSEGAAFSATQTVTEFTTSETARNWTDAAPTSTVFAAGDRIVVKVFAAAVGGANMTAGTANIYIDGATGATGDSFVTFTENISFTRTRTVKSSGGDYTTLSAYEAGEQGDLTALTEVRQAELYALQDTTALTFGGWTTSSTYYIKVYTTGAGRNTTGVYDGANYYRLEVTTSAIQVGAGAGNIWFDGLQIKVTASSGGPVAIWLTNAITAGTAKISNCILLGVLSGTAAGAAAIYAPTLASGSATLQMWNTIAYNWTGGSGGHYAFTNGTSWTCSLYNCTAYNCNTGFFPGAATSCTAINCIANSCTDGFKTTSSGFTASSNYNTSDVASDAPGANSRNGTAVTFVNAAGGNFQPAYNDTEAKGTGTDDPGSGLFSDDIKGTTRPAGWDMGAFIVQATPVAGVKDSLMMMGAGI